MKNLQERYRATMLCAAIGDTLGMPVEGWKPSQIRRHVGKITHPIAPILSPDQDEEGPLPHISLHAKKGSWTDDTKLLATTARSIAEVRGLDLVHLAQKSVEMYEKELRITQEDPTNSFGRTTIAAFENLRRGVSPYDSGVLSGYGGNAPALKMPPVGMYMHATGKYKEGLTFAQQAGKMTHLDERSVVSGIVQAHAVYLLLHENPTAQEFIQSVTQVSQQWEKRQEGKTSLSDRLQWVADNFGTTTDEEAHQKLKSGWFVIQSYPFVLYMVLKYWDNPKEGLLRLVNFGGDCDSTAAIYGALAGAKNGFFVPKQWINTLEKKEELTKLADTIFQIK